MGSFGGGGGGGEQDWTAANISKEVSRDIWETYKTDYTDWENEMISTASDTSSVRAEAKKHAVLDTENAFSQAKNAFSMENERMGLDIKPDHQKVLDRQDSLEKAASTANNINRSRDNVEDRAMQLMAGGVSTKNNM
jgi:hypothetical protein